MREILLNSGKSSLCNWKMNESYELLISATTDALMKGLNQQLYPTPPIDQKSMWASISRVTDQFLQNVQIVGIGIWQWGLTPSFLHLQTYKEILTYLLTNSLSHK